MFPFLPEELERMIWMKYYNYVLDEVRDTDSVWVKPSYSLFMNTSDRGAIQIGHTDLERRYDCDTEPHCGLLRWILDYDDYDICCEDCHYAKWGYCEIERNDKEFEDNANSWWEFLDPEYTL